MLGWLSRWGAEVPPDREWLSPAERRVLSGLTVQKRRADWLLGRWTAKSAVAVRLGVPASRVEVLAAGDGTPEARLDGCPTGLALSLSHRADRALAVVGEAETAVGCDLEVIEPRSAAFIGDWLAADEQARLAELSDPERARLANLMWTAKEAAAKVRREGLRLDVRGAVADTGELVAADGRWRPLQVRWAAGAVTRGWWRAEPGWIMTVAAEPGAAAPRELEREQTMRGRTSTMLGDR